MQGCSTVNLVILHLCLPETQPLTNSSPGYYQTLGSGPEHRMAASPIYLHWVFGVPLWQLGMAYCPDSQTGSILSPMGLEELANDFL